MNSFLFDFFRIFKEGEAPVICEESLADSPDYIDARITDVTELRKNRRKMRGLE